MRSGSHQEDDRTQCPDDGHPEEDEQAR